MAIGQTSGLSYQDWLMLQQLQQQGLAQQAAQAQQTQAQTAEQLQSAISTGATAPQQQTQSTAKDGQDDGHISFWEKIKHVGKGALHFVTGMFTDEKGNFSIGQTLKNVAIGVGVAALCVATAGTAVPAIIAGAGVAMAGTGLVKSGYKAATAKTDAEAEEAWEGLGTNTVALAASVAGAKGAMKSYNSAKGITTDYSGFKGSLRAVKDSTTIGFKEGYKGVKIGVNALKEGNFKTTVAQSASNYKSLVSSNLKNAFKTPTVAETHEQNLEKYDSQIKELEAQKENLSGRELAKMNSKIERLKSQKTNYETNYSTIDKVDNFGEAQKEILKLESEISDQKAKLSTTSNSITKTKLTQELNNMKQQLDTYKSVVNQKTTLARNLRSNIAQAKKNSKSTVELEAQQKALNFELPDVQGNASYARLTGESASDVVKLQIENSKKQYELSQATEEYTKYGFDDDSFAAQSARRNYDKVKLAADNTEKALKSAKVALKYNKAFTSATSGYDYLGSLTGKSKTFAQAFNKEFGTETTQSRAIPFTKYTIPSIKVSNGKLMLASNSLVNPSLNGNQTADSQEAIAQQIYSSFTPQQQAEFAQLPQDQQAQILNAYMQQVA